MLSAVTNKSVSLHQLIISDLLGEEMVPSLIGNYSCTNSGNSGSMCVHAEVFTYLQNRHGQLSHVKFMNQYPRLDPGQR